MSKDAFNPQNTNSISYICHNHNIRVNAKILFV